MNKIVGSKSKMGINLWMEVSSILDKEFPGDNDFEIVESDGYEKVTIKNMKDDKVYVVDVTDGSVELYDQDDDYKRVSWRLKRDRLNKNLRDEYDIVSSISIDKNSMLGGMAEEICDKIGEYKDIYASVFEDGNENDESVVDRDMNKINMILESLQAYWEEWYTRSSIHFDAMSR